MPKVPDYGPSGPAMSLPYADVKPEYLLMSAALMHEQGRLFEDRTKDTQEAIASGAMDPQGKNFTTFRKK